MLVTVDTCLVSSRNNNCIKLFLRLDYLQTAHISFWIRDFDFGGSGLVAVFIFYPIPVPVSEQVFFVTNPVPGFNRSTIVLHNICFLK